MKIEAFVIHLKRAELRRVQVAQIVSACPVHTHIVDAVDARDLSQADIDNVYQRNLLKPRFPFEMGNGEVACFLSHRKVWQMIVDSDLDAGLVLEDDIKLDKDVLPRALEVAAKFIGQGSYVQFQVRNLKSLGDDVVRDGEFSVTTPTIVPLRASSQLIDRIAAQRLLAITEVFDRPIDAVVQLKWLTGVAVKVILPSGVTEHSAALGGTTIQVKKKSLARRLRHEIQRGVYRMQIRKMSASS